MCLYSSCDPNPHASALPHLPPTSSIRLRDFDPSHGGSLALAFVPSRANLRRVTVERTPIGDQALCVIAEQLLACEEGGLEELKFVSCGIVAATILIFWPVPG